MTCYPESAVIWAFVYGALAATFICAMLYAWTIKTGDREGERPVNRVLKWWPLVLALLLVGVGLALAGCEKTQNTVVGPCGMALICVPM